MSGLIVFLSRHAERQALEGVSDDDQPLTDAGTARAALLARMVLGNPQNGLMAVFASGVVRTRQTATPTAAAAGLNVREVPAVDETVRELRRLQAQTGVGPRSALVVGHSNTLGPIIAGLGGPGILPIATEEVDNLFVLFIPPPGDQGSPPAAVSLASLKYGEESPGGGPE